MKFRPIIPAIIVCGCICGYTYFWIARATPHPPITKDTTTPHPPKQPIKQSIHPVFPVATTPTQLIVPKVTIAAPIEKVGLTNNGNMDVPKSETALGWYQGGVFPGNQGPAVLAGHTGYPDRPSPFRKLEQLQPGDHVQVKDMRDQIATFTVTAVASYTPESSPIQQIFGKTTDRRLTIITCTGTWLPRQKTYSHRLVIYTQRIK